MVAPTRSGYSARVRLELWIGDERFALGQIGGGKFMLAHEAVIPGTTGEIVAHIDDHEQRWQATWEASDAPRRIVKAEFRQIHVGPLNIPSHS